MDLLPPGLHLRRDLLATGVTDRELRRLRRAGDLHTVCPGAYVAGAGDPLRDPAARHLLAVRAAVARLGPGTVISHVSAAVVHRLPLWQVPLDRVHATRDRTSGARRSSAVHLHAAALEADEVVEIGGLLVTTVARTLADLARSLPFEPALVPTDAALHRHLVTRAALAEAVERGLRRPGNAAARRVVAFSDGRAESPGETRSRVAIHRAGLPPPVLQHEFAASGSRVDFWWERVRTVGEFDGRVKYGRLLRPGQEPGDAVFEEKLREDALRDHGLDVVRWVRDDLARFDPVAARLRRAFARE